MYWNSNNTYRSVRVGAMMNQLNTHDMVATPIDIPFAARQAYWQAKRALKVTRAAFMTAVFQVSLAHETGENQWNSQVLMTRLSIERQCHVPVDGLFRRFVKRVDANLPKSVLFPLRISPTIAPIALELDIVEDWLKPHLAYTPGTLSSTMVDQLQKRFVDGLAFYANRLDADVAQPFRTASLQQPVVASRVRQWQWANI